MPPAESRPRFQLTRRGLLLGVGGALGIAVGYALWPRSYPGGMLIPGGETSFGPWLRIAPDGRTTVAVPQAETGQGVLSVFAQIVADELGADWRMMAVEPAQWHPIYANATALREVADGLPRMPALLARYLPSQTAERLNLQLTALSTSVRNYHHGLRLAAAQARAVLLTAAADKWGVAAAALDSANGQIHYKANHMPFADAIRLADSKRTLPEAELRATPGLLVGRSLPRLDLPPKVDGRARFGADVRIPGLAYAAIRHGPVGGSLAQATAPTGIALVKGPNWVATTGPTNWHARRQLAQIKAEFRPPAHPADSAAIARSLQQAVNGSGGDVLLSRGDVEAAPGADNAIDVRYELAPIAHAAAEPLVATARLAAGRAEIWGPTQAPGFAHHRVAEALALPVDAVSVYPTLVGGAGRAIEPDAMVEAALIARATGRPVQLGWSRAEDFQNSRPRPPAVVRARARMDGTRIAAIDIRVATPVLLADILNRQLPDAAPAADAGNRFDLGGLIELPYASAALRLTHAPVQLPLPVGYWRGGPQAMAAFVGESLMDELAAISGADPVEFRLAHLADRPRHARALRAVAHAAGWGTPPATGRGRGVALHGCFGSVCAMAVTAGVDAGRVRIDDVAIAIDCGRAIAPDSVRAQLQSAAIMGLSTALAERLDFRNGFAVQRDFDQYPLLRLADAPRRITTVLVNGDSQPGGVSEVALPLAAPALANALARATGKRARQLPLAAAYAG